MERWLGTEQAQEKGTAAGLLWVPDWPAERL